MFNWRVNHGQKPLERLETIVGLETVMEGTVRSQGAVRIDGKVHGGVTAHEVVVGEQGHVEGNIDAKTVIVAGKVTGNIVNTQSLELLPSAQIHGDIQATTLHVAEGATFEGNCLMTNGRAKTPRAEVEI